MSEDKIKLIFIAGSGHCGSTLLDLIVESSPEVFSAGEMAFYNVYRSQEEYKGAKYEHICTCGENFTACCFWKRVNQAGDFRIKKKYSFVENCVMTLKILFDKGDTASDDTFGLCREILAQADDENGQIQYVLDSSKDPRRLYSLLNDEKIEVYPILMTRDCRKVAHSYSRKKRRDDHGLKSHNYLLSLLFRCLFVNFLSSRMIKNNKNGLIISYEEFCDDPVKHIRMINKKLSVNIDEENYLEQVNSKTYHNIGGNALRFGEITEIRKR